MSAAFSQSMQTASISQGTSPTVRLTNNVAVGNFILVAIFRWAPTTVESCTLADGLGNTYTQRGTGVIDTLVSDNVSMNLFSAPVTVSGVCTITATITARFANLIAHEVAGTALSFDNFALATAANTAGTDSTTSGTATVAAGAYLASFAANSGGGVHFDPGKSFTSRITANWSQAGDWVGSEDRIVDISGGTLAGTWTGGALPGGYLAGFLSVVDAVALAESPLRMPLGD